MRRRGPVNLAVQPGIEHEALAAGRIAEIARALNLPLDDITEVAQGLHERTEGFAFAARVGTILLVILALPHNPLGEQRAPIQKRGDILHEDIVHLNIGTPAEELPGLGAALLFAGFAAIGEAMESAFAGRTQQVQTSGRDDARRPQVLDGLADMADIDAVLVVGNEIDAMGIDGRLPMVDGG